MTYAEELEFWEKGEPALLTKEQEIEVIQIRLAWGIPLKKEEDNG